MKEHVFEFVEFYPDSQIASKMVVVEVTASSREEALQKAVGDQLLPKIFPGKVPGGFKEVKPYPQVERDPLIHYHIYAAT